MHPFPFCFVVWAFFLTGKKWNRPQVPIKYAPLLCYIERKKGGDGMQIPKNVIQTGETDPCHKIYMEDYVHTLLTQYRENEADFWRRKNRAGN